MHYGLPCTACIALAQHSRLQCGPQPRPSLRQAHHTLPLPPPTLHPFLPPLPQVVILVSALLAALFLVLLQLPVPGGSVIMPGLAFAWAAGLPLAMAAQAASSLPPLPEAAERLLPDSDRELDEERRDAIW